MVDEIARMLRPAVSGEIGGRSHRELAQVRAEAHRDHVALDHLADADRRVEAAGNDIDHLVVDGDVEHDIGIGLGESRPGSARYRSRQPSGMHGCEPCRRGARGSAAPVRSPAPSSDTAGRTRWNRFAPASVSATLRVVRLNSRTPDPLLEAAHHLAQCRRRHAEHLRRAAEAHQFADDDEGP